MVDFSLITSRSKDGSKGWKPWDSRSTAITVLDKVPKAGAGFSGTGGRE